VDLVGGPGTVFNRPTRQAGVRLAFHCAAEFGFQPREHCKRHPTLERLVELLRKVARLGGPSQALVESAATAGSFCPIRECVDEHPQVDARPTEINRPSQNPVGFIRPVQPTENRSEHAQRCRVIYAVSAGRRPHRELLPAQRFTRHYQRVCDLEGDDERVGPMADQFPRSLCIRQGGRCSAVSTEPDDGVGDEFRGAFRVIGRDPLGGRLKPLGRIGPSPPQRDPCALVLGVGTEQRVLAEREHAVHVLGGAAVLAGEKRRGTRSVGPLRPAFLVWAQSRGQLEGTRFGVASAPVPGKPRCVR
jgi:hypothetical protein